MARTIHVGPIPGTNNIPWSASLAPGECPHALTVWVETKDERSPRPAFRRAQVRCRAEHSLQAEHEFHGRRWT